MRKGRDSVSKRKQRWINLKQITKKGEDVAMGKNAPDPQVFDASSLDLLVLMQVSFAMVVAIVVVVVVVVFVSNLFVVLICLLHLGQSKLGKVFLLEFGANSGVQEKLTLIHNKTQKHVCGLIAFCQILSDFIAENF